MPAFFVMARFESIWGTDADAFKPKRWLHETPGGRVRLRAVSPFQFPVFNAGPRRCLGEAIALLESKIVAAALLRAFRFELEHPERVTYSFTLTLPVLDGTLRARVTRA
jgi:cytochrome P450